MVVRAHERGCEVQDVTPQVVEQCPSAWHRYHSAPARLHLWRFAGRTYDLSRRVLVMGVVNCTPDSFFAPSRCQAEEAVRRAMAMVEAGADLVDVGGESTRPGASEVPVDEELRRVIPVVRELCREGVTVSIDTRHVPVARRALEEGAAIVNDVRGMRDPAMRALMASCDAGGVVMHMRGEPATMQQEPRYEWVVGEVACFLADSLDLLEEAGVSPERLVVDPGIGFGKTLAHNLELLRHIPDLLLMGRPVLVGVSRKSFIGHILGLPPEERLEGSLAAATAAVLRGARIVRVHDVRETVRAMRVAEHLL